MKQAFLALVGLIGMSSIEASVIWTNCDDCGLAARQQAAANHLTPNSYSWVYVVDASSREVSKFEVLSEIEPGHYNVEVNLVETEQEALNGTQQAWALIDELQSGEIDIPENPSECDQNAASFVVDFDCQGWVRNELENGSSFASLLNGLLANLGITASNVYAALGQNHNLVTTITFPDGSKAKIMVKFAIVLKTGKLTIERVEILEAKTAAGDFLPLSRDDMANYVSSHIAGGSIGDLEYMWSNWGVSVTHICNVEYESRARCTTGPNGQITCTVEGIRSCRP